MTKADEQIHDMFSLRVDEGRGCDEHTLTEWLRDLGCAYLLSFEEGDSDENPHFHAWICITSKEQALRQRFKRRFQDVKGNKCYSLTPVREPENYKRYCVKGTEHKPAVIISKYGMGEEYTDEGIAEMRKVYWELKAATAKEIAEKKKERAKDFRASIWEECANIPDPNYYKVASVIYDAYVDADKAFDTYAIKRLANITMAKLDRRRGATAFKKAVLDDVVTGAGYAYDLGKQNVDYSKVEIDI